MTSAGRARKAWRRIVVQESMPGGLSARTVVICEVPRELKLSALAIGKILHTLEDWLKRGAEPMPAVKKRINLAERTQALTSGSYCVRNAGIYGKSEAVEANQTAFTRVKSSEKPKRTKSAIMAAPRIRDKVLYLDRDIPVADWISFVIDRAANEVYIDAAKVPADRLIELAQTVHRAFAKCRSVLEPVVLGPVSDGTQIERIYREQMRTTDQSFDTYCEEVARQRRVLELVNNGHRGNDWPSR